MNLAKQIAYFLLRVVSGFTLVQTGGLILFGWFGEPFMRSPKVLTRAHVAPVRVVQSTV